MKIKTADLIGAQLDWAVAKCEKAGVTGIDSSGRCRIVGNHTFSPSTDWSQGGPIIERENIAVLPPVVKRISEDRHAFTVNYFRAMIQQDEDKIAIHGRGPTPLIAAMRCYVASKMGDEIEIPKELL